ncbi:MAG: DUF262 domain-containing protein [Dehalococcoidia bacterium]|nr:DUF262 domain-containing protein [Dehalococcoidia bacterium]
MPALRDSLKGEAISIHELLSPTAELRYSAPEFQRHYVWRTDGSDSQIARFWADVDRLENEGTGDGDADSLFLGAIVLQIIDAGGPGKSPLLSIIDGQQRLTTLYLVFVAIAEAYQDCGQPHQAADIERQYLLSQVSTSKDEPRLRPTISDIAQFREILSCLRNPRPRFEGVGSGEKTGRMTEAWAVIRRRVREICADDDDDGALSPDKLYDLLLSVAERIELVSITLGVQHDPHEVYERLNTGGEPLKVIDLTRNEVFLVAGPEATERFYYDYWGPFEENLGIQYQDSYFFPYALIRDSSTTKARMYETLRTYWKGTVTQGKAGEQAAQAIVQDLEEFLPSYHALVGVSRPSTLDSESWSAIERLQRLDVPSTMYPYFIQLIDARLKGSVSTDDLVKATRIIDSFVVRRVFLGFSNTGIHTVFKRLWSAAGADPKKLIENLEVRTVQFPSDDDFRRSILEAAIFRSSKCRYILTEYERSFSKGDLSEWNPHEVTVDHLIPQNPTLKDWPGISAEQHDAVVDTWANLVPLSGKANSEKSAGNWDQTRKMMLEESGTVFKSTRAVFDQYKQWDAEAIGDRGRRLADWALERWPKG